MSPTALPAGFVERHLPKQLWWVKAGWESTLAEILDRLPSAPGLPGGRGMIYRVKHEANDTVLVRPYRRGGLIRHIVRDLYWDRPFRPLAELTYTETARHRGVPTVQVIGAGIKRARPPFYRGMLITREAQGFINLWDWLCSTPDSGARETVIGRVAITIAHLHNVGIAHTDLNLTNILVRMTAGVAEALLLDFDQARIFSGPLSHHWRAKNLHRLRRSLVKLDPAGLLHSPADVGTFCRAYHG